MNVTTYDNYLLESTTQTDLSSFESFVNTIDTDSILDSIGELLSGLEFAPVNTQKTITILGQTVQVSEFLKRDTIIDSYLISKGGQIRVFYSDNSSAIYKLNSTVKPILNIWAMATGK